MKSGWKIGIGAIVFAVTVLVYAVNCRNAFVRYDDFDYIVKNVALEHGLNRRSVVWSFLAGGYASNWHPLTWLSHAADVTLADRLGFDWRLPKNEHSMVAKLESPFVVLVHAENVVLHAVNAVLLWMLMLRALCFMSRASDGADGVRALPELTAAFFALLWALHPLRVEVVAWAAERKELLSVMFMLLTMIAWISGRRGWGLCLFALALMAKPVAVSLPAVLFAWDWAVERRGFGDAVRRVLPFGCFAVADCLLTMCSQTEALDTAGRTFTHVQQAMSAVEAPVRYLAQTFWPAGLNVDYLLPNWSGWPWFAAGCVLLLAGAAGVAFACWWLVRRPGSRSPIPLFLLFAAWCYIGLVPMLGIVKVGYEPHSDRYTYWIGCGFAACACWMAMLYERHWRPYARQIAYGACGILAVLSVLSVVQAGHWRNTERLFARAVAGTANEFFALPLSEDIIFNDRARTKDAEDMLRDVLDRQHTDNARAALALHLASFGPYKRPPQGVTEGAGTGFAEARLLAEISLESKDPVAIMWSRAALGFADYRDGRKREAYENMKRAMDMGYQSGVAIVNLEDWKKKADEEEASRKKEGQNGVE